MKNPSHSTSYFFDVKGQLPEQTAPAKVPILIRKKKGARSIILRYQPHARALTLTLPPYVAVRRGLTFVEEKRMWILRELAHKAAAAIPFTNEAVIPLLGETLTLRHVGGRGVVRLSGNVLEVPGDMNFMERRVRDWLKKRAREEITGLAQEKAAQLGCKITRITLRDTRSLWGSCTEDGRLSFSWRLILASPEVLDYLVSHEVAHIRELNHSPAFWRLVEELCPSWRTSRAWLKKHGDTLHRYG